MIGARRLLCAPSQNLAAERGDDHSMTASNQFWYLRAILVSSALALVMYFGGFCALSSYSARHPAYLRGLPYLRPAPPWLIRGMFLSWSRLDPQEGNLIVDRIE